METKEIMFLKPNSKLRLDYVVITTSEFSPEKHSLTVVELQRQPDYEKIDSQKESSG